MRSRWWPVVVLSALGLLYTPVISGFAPGHDTSVLRMDWHHLLRAAVNWKHVVPFALLFVLAARAFGGAANSLSESARVLKAASLVLVYSILLEVTQGFFAEGHCRIWDVAANGFGVAWGWAGIRVAQRISRRVRQGSRPKT